MLGGSEVGRNEHVQLILRALTAFPVTAKLPVRPVQQATFVQATNKSSAKMTETTGAVWHRKAVQAKRANAADASHRFQALWMTSMSKRLCQCCGSHQVRRVRMAGSHTWSPSGLSQRQDLLLQEYCSFSSSCLPCGASGGPHCRALWMGSAQNWTQKNSGRA